MCPNSPAILSFDFNAFLEKQNCSVFNNFFIIGWNIMKSTQCTPYSLKAFRWYQEHDKRHPDLGDLNVQTKQNKQGVCHTLALPFTLKVSWKEELRKLKYFTMKNSIFEKSSKKNQNPSRYYNSIINLQVSTQAKISSFKKSSYKNRPIT